MLMLVGILGRRHQEHRNISQHPFSASLAVDESGPSRLPDPKIESTCEKKSKSV